MFCDEELETLRDIVGTFAHWPAWQLAEYVHSEPAWLETTDRQTIRLSYACTLRLQ